MTDRSWTLAVGKSVEPMKTAGHQQPVGERIIRAFLLLGFAAVLLIEISLLIRALPLG